MKGENRVYPSESLLRKNIKSTLLIKNAGLWDLSKNSSNRMVALHLSYIELKNECEIRT